MPFMVGVNSKKSMFCGICSSRVGVGYTMDGPITQILTLPPCRSALVQHILRANFQMAIWRRAASSVVDMPEPNDGHGWTQHGTSVV